MSIQPAVFAAVAGGKTLASRVRSMFAGGQQGAWFDPSDFSTMFQDSNGTTPVTAVEQPVGLILDKRLGTSAGPELITNGTFDANTAGWTAAPGYSSTAAAVNGEIQVTPTTNYGSQITSFPTVIGAIYRITCMVRKVSGTENAYATVTNSTGISDLGLIGTPTNSQSFVRQSRIYKANTTTTYIALRGTQTTTFAGQVAAFDNISIKEVLGNHASQTTATSRPKLSARKNNLLRTDDIGSGAFWSGDAGSIAVLTSIPGPAAGTFAHRFTPGLTGSAPSASAFGGSGNRWFGEPNTFPLRRQTNSMWFKTDSLNSDVALYLVNYQTDTVKAVSTFTTTSEWTLVTVTGTTDTNGSRFVFASKHPVLVALPQNEGGSVATRYQRAGVSATDYDSVGFPLYLAFDGVDDSLQTQVVNLGNPELVVNGRFDTDVSGWAADQGASLSNVGGAMQVYANATGAFPYGGQQVTGLVVGRTYYASWRQRSLDGNSARVYLRPSGYDNATNEITTPTHSAASWTPVNHTFVAQGTAMFVRASIVNPTAVGQRAEFDDFTIQEAGAEKLTAWAAFGKLGTAANQILVELSPLTDAANPGSFNVHATTGGGSSPGGALAHTGTAAIAFGSTDVGVPGVIAVGYDFAGANGADEFTVSRINGVDQARTVVLPGPAGHRNFGTYPIYIGSRGGSTLPFNGHLHQLVIRAAASSSAAELTYGERLCAAKSGVAL